MSSEPEGPSGPANPTPGVSEEMPEVPRAVDLGEMLAPAVMPVIEFRPYDIVTFFKSLPDEIKDILIRESYLARAAEILTAKQVENKQDHAKVQARRPMLMAVRPQARIAYEGELAEAEKEVQFFARALTQNDAAMDNLRKAARRHLEVWLRNHDTTYMSGLASEQLLSDWRNAMELVSSIMLDFVKSLGEARNLMVSGYDKENNIYSPQALDALNRAVKVGAALDADTASVNVIAEKHDQMLQGTVFENPFPRLPIFAAEEHTSNARTRPIALLQKHFDRVKGYYEELNQKGVPALREAIEKAEQRQVAVRDSYMTTLWAGLRTEANKLVEEDRLDVMVRETEEHFLSGGYF